MDNFLKIEQWLNDNEVLYKKNIDLSKFTWIRLGGICKIMIYPKNKLQLILLIKIIKEYRLKFKIFGNFSNVLIRDGKINTLIISLKYFNTIEKKKEKNGIINLNVESGVTITKLVYYLLSEKISGYEGLIGIPGTIGGGLYMNCSSYGSRLIDKLDSIDCLTVDGNQINFKKKDINYSYRNSYFQKKNYIILGANFSFKEENKKKHEKILKLMNRYKKHRMLYQEKQKPNLGSLFKSEKGIYYDMSRISLIFKFMYYVILFIEKLIPKLYLNKNKNKINYKIINFRKFYVRLYCKILNLDKNYFSSLTLNCIIKKDNSDFQSVLNNIQKIKDKTKSKIPLEIEIYNNIE